MKKVNWYLALTFVIFLPSAIFPQTASSSSSTAGATSTVAVPYGPFEFPEWQKDLRRAEIIAAGSLPFVTIMTKMGYGIYRYYSNDQNKAYAPWPFKDKETAIELSESDQKSIFFAAVGISIGVAVVDYGFKFVRRAVRNNRARRDERDRYDPIVITPLD
jgi:hypothetical protein